MRNPGGYGVATDRETGVVLKEEDSYRCIHCQRHVFVKPKQRPEDLGGFCRLCTAPVCPQCHDKGTCDHFEKKLERAEASYHARRSYGM